MFPNRTSRTRKRKVYFALPNCSRLVLRGLQHIHKTKREATAVGIALYRRENPRFFPFRRRMRESFGRTEEIERACARARSPAFKLKFHVSAVATETTNIGDENIAYLKHRFRISDPERRQLRKFSKENRRYFREGGKRVMCSFVFVRNDLLHFRGRAHKRLS